MGAVHWRLAALIPLTACGGRSGAAPEPSPVPACPAEVVGDWLGVARGGAVPIELRVSIGCEGGVLLGEADMPARGRYALPLRGFTGDGSSADPLRFTLAQSEQAASDVRFRVGIDGTRMAGTAATPIGALDVDLSRRVLHPLPATAAAAIAGTYRGEDVEILVVQMGSHLLRVDGGTPEELFPVGTHELVTIGGDRYTVFEERTGASITWQAAGARVVAHRQPHTHESEEFAFDSAGGVRLTGTFRRPGRAGRHPAVLLVHGSGEGPRYERSLARLADHLVQSGIAVLTFDKRGSGLSSGSWRGASFDDLAADARAGVRALRSRPDVDPDQVGVWGISQAGWVLPRLPADEAPAFMVLASAPGTSVADQERARVVREMAADGFDEAAIAEAAGIVRAASEAAAQGVDVPLALEAQLISAAGRPWASYVGILGTVHADGLDRPAAAVALRMLAEGRDQPMRLSSIRCPVLVVFGERDQTVPPVDNLPAMRRAFAAGTNADVTFVGVPGVDHNFLPTESGGRRETLQNARTAAQLSDVYLSAISEWLLARVEVVE